MHFGLLLLVACAPHLAAPTMPTATAPAPSGWFPLGKSELSPQGQRQAYAWRDARVAGPSAAFDAALDRAGRLWVATLEYVAGRFVVRVRVRDGGAWRQLPDLESPVLNERAYGQIAFTTDETDAPVLVWQARVWDGETATTSAGWARWADGAWASAALPPVPGDQEGLIGVSAAGGTSRVYLHLWGAPKGDDVILELEPAVGVWLSHPVGHGVLQRTASVGGRVEWVVFDPDEGTVLWSGPDVVAAPAKNLLRLDVYPGHGDPLTEVPREDPRLVVSPAGWKWLPAHSARYNTVATGAPGGALLMEGYPHLVGTHYVNEVNRLVVWRRTVFGWRAVSEVPLPTALMYMERARLLPTPAPTIVVAGRDGVSVLQWNGKDWWGLDGEPMAAGDLGEPQFAASQLQFIGSTLGWRELTEAGHRMRLARWESGKWQAQATQQLPGSTWLWGGDSGFTHLLLRSRGSWDRVGGLMNEETEPAMFTWSGDGKVDIPMPQPIPAGPEVCGAAGKPACVPTSFVSLPDGSVLAAINADDLAHLFGSGGAPAPQRPWEIQRFSDGKWALEATVELPRWHEPVLQGGSPASLLYAEQVWVRHDGTWAPIPWPTAEKPWGASALGLGGNRLLLTWRPYVESLPTGVSGYTLHAAEWDGASWSPREVGLPTEQVTQQSLAQSPDGGSWLAFTTLNGEIRLLRWVEDRWVGVAGSDVGGGVSNSPADSYGPAIGFIDGNVCVAWSEAADLAARVNVRCHRLGAATP